MPRTTRTCLQPFLIPTGAVATKETLRTGDTVLVWTQADFKSQSNDFRHLNLDTSEEFIPVQHVTQ